jgi:hypothetical protein
MTGNGNPMTLHGIAATKVEVFVVKEVSRIKLGASLKVAQVKN